MPRFQFTLGRMLVLVLLACVGLIAIQDYFARVKFTELKAKTSEKLAGLNWEGIPQQPESVLDALSQVTYGNCNSPRIGLVVINKMLIAAKMEKFGISPYSLMVEWFVLDNRINKIRVNLKGGNHVDYQFSETFQLTGLCHQGSLSLGEIQVRDPQDIESVSLICDGRVVAGPILAQFAPNVATADQ